MDNGAGQLLLFRHLHAHLNRIMPPILDVQSMRLTPPATEGVAITELLLAVRIETRNAHGQYQAIHHMIRLQPDNEDSYATSEQTPRGAQAAWLTLDPLLLPATGP